MVAAQGHRGPDGGGVYIDPDGFAALGHNRLSIIDLSDAGREPMHDPAKRYWLTFNGEIYNYLELRRQLQAEFPFQSNTDAEVIIAAFLKWGQSCLDRFIGMFAFAIWDEKNKQLFAARDRFGVKPFYYIQSGSGELIFSSEIKGIQALGVGLDPDHSTWASYLACGTYDHREQTFWEGIRSLAPGGKLTWCNGALSVTSWYDLAERCGQEYDQRPIEVVEEEYRELLDESVRLRFRSDVPVGINLSGGLDSSVLLGLVQAVRGVDSVAKAFTFVTGDPRYDELPWVRQMLAVTNHESIECRIQQTEVPRLAESVQYYQDEPFGGLPTLAYARLFERARDEGVIVLLDAQGMDEQWAGYDYYELAQSDHGRAPFVQGINDPPVKPGCLKPEFRQLCGKSEFHEPFADALRNLQYRDARYSKIPRALRFNDRVSMRVGTELREPFLDHRLFELALRQPAERKIQGSIRKWLLRRMMARAGPEGVMFAPKRPLQTPQREWLRGGLSGWAYECIQEGLCGLGSEWLDAGAVQEAFRSFVRGESDNSFYVWQWISVGLMSLLRRAKGPTTSYLYSEIGQSGTLDAWQA
jgi:asparagine synthase (glutamine-hydrolysing)